MPQPNGDLGRDQGGQQSIPVWSQYGLAAVPRAIPGPIIPLPGVTVIPGTIMLAPNQHWPHQFHY